MNKKIKKIMACLMATASLATGMVGLSASAYTSADSYSEFTWYIEGTDAKAKLKNTSGTSRYAQVVVFSWGLDGSYKGQSTPGYGNISNNGLVSTSGTPYGTSYEFDGTLYLTGLPQGTPISTWVKTLSR